MSLFVTKMCLFVCHSSAYHVVLAGIKARCLGPADARGEVGKHCKDNKGEGHSMPEHELKEDTVEGWMRTKSWVYWICQENRGVESEDGRERKGEGEKREREKEIRGHWLTVYTL